MLFAFRPGNCDVVWEFGCGELILYCVVEVRGVCFFCGCLVLGEECLLPLGKLWWVLC
jgi:hypothetical protein